MGPEEMEQHYKLEDGSALKHNSRISLPHVAFKSLLWVRQAVGCFHY